MHYHCNITASDMINTATASTETGLVNGFAWLIYFSVAKTEQLKTKTEARDLRLKIEIETQGSETETETQGFETKTETLKFQSQDVLRPRLESRELHLCALAKICF